MDKEKVGTGNGLSGWRGRRATDGGRKARGARPWRRVEGEVERKKKGGHAQLEKKKENSASAAETLERSAVLRLCFNLPAERSQGEGAREKENGEPRGQVEFFQTDRRPFCLLACLSL